MKGFLKEQMDSLLAQTYAYIEIIISDDASNDSTRQILKEYETNPSITLFFQEKNLGAGKNFEFAVKQAKGAFIAFSDQDDIWLPEKIEAMYRAIGDSFLIYSDSELVDENGNSLHKNLSSLRRMYTGDQAKGFVFSNVVWGHAMLINSQSLPSVIPVPAGIPHDIWMGFKAATITGIKYLDRPLTKYRQHADTVTKTIAVKAVSKPAAIKYEEFTNKLYWIGIMRDHERPERKEFYQRLYELYAQKSTGRYGFKLLFFLLRHRAALFMFTRKKWTSQVIELIKQARGVSR
ncbi:MAG: glycosyltransferase [Bacteroidota bacterium]